MIKRTLKRVLHPVLSPFSPGNIVMFHLGRSGSTVLAELVRQHSRVYWGAELYNRTFMQWVRENDGREVIGELPDDAVSLLKRDMKHALHRYYGFEVKPFHFRLIGYPADAFIPILDRLNFKHFIILDRKNRLRKVVSSIIAHQDRSRYHIGQNKKLKVRKVHINVEQVEIDFDSKPLLNYLRDFDTQFEELRKALGDRNVLEISYEEHIMNDPMRAYQEVCRYVGLKPGKVDVKLSRTNPYPVRDMIENISEVESVLKDTPYHWMLTD